MNYKIIEHGTVYASNDIFGYAAWPTVAKTADGTILVACSAYRMGHICPFGKTSLIRSLDGGKTWSALTPIISTPLDDRDGGLCVFGKNVMITSFNNSIDFQLSQIKSDSVDKKDGVKLAYLGCLDKSEAEKMLGSTYKISNDGGETFGDMGILPITSPHGPCALDDGRLFYIGRSFSSPESNPKLIYGHPNKNERIGEYAGLSDGLYYMFSSDGGKTWSDPLELPYIKDIWDGGFCCEPHAIQLRSGRILVHFRVEKAGVHGMFSTYQCYSDDGGKTFSAPTRVVERGAPPHLLQLHDGTVICSYGYRREPFGQRARYSTDNGDTWSEEIILRDDGESWDLGYPSTAELDDGTLITVYYQRERGRDNNGIYYTKWTLER